ncbi:hypothetical protein AFM18_18910 [Achromobacter spanius]|uniref:Uncharacterized protein n=1 Tax=Achromobacter spanius TaxID=217203 RepID=A0AAW3I0B5_9BURK|nr:hypothetical protein AFM18_18910 [Achromobacter spanius]
MNVPAASAARIFSVLVSDFHDFRLGCYDFGIIELSCFSNACGEVIRPEMNHIDTRNRTNFFDIVEAFACLNHAYEQAYVLKLSNCLRGR